MMDERLRPTVPYDWAWSLHPSVLIGTGLLGALYFYGIGPLRRRRGHPPASPWQILSFSAALLVLLRSLNGPVHDLSDYYLFSVHMVQHLVLTLVFPPLLLAGIPEWLLRPLLMRPGLLRVARFLTRPWFAAALFSASIALWHLTTLLRPDDEKPRGAHRHSPDVHGDGHADVVAGHEPAAGASGFRPDSSMLYLFLVGIPMQIVAALITFADEVLYPWYAFAPRTWGLSPLDDQQLGGLIMWIPGNL